MADTLDKLPGEGEVVTVTKIRTRYECDICGESAHYKHSFLLNGARSNPSSSAYGKDDCSWCSDEEVFTCKEHEKEGRKSPDGYSWCSTFSATGFAHMFLYWREVKK